jgi:hypothetical protein
VWRPIVTEGWVVFAYVVVYGFMVGYALYLATKRRSLAKRAEN